MRRRLLPLTPTNTHTRQHTSLTGEPAADLARPRHDHATSRDDRSARQASTSPAIADALEMDEQQRYRPHYTALALLGDSERDERAPARAGWSRHAL